MRTRAIVPIVLLVALLAACGDDDDDATSTPPSTTSTSAAPGMTIEVDAFSDGGMIPVAYTCDGEQTEPKVTWSGEPAATKAIAITVVDPDAGGFQHWIRVGDVDGTPWRGPCPPEAKPHHYVFTVHALDRADVEPTLEEITAHTIASASITGVYARDPDALDD